MVGSLNSRQKNSDDAAADDVDGCGVMCAAADVEASGVLNAVDGVHAFDVAADDGVRTSDVAADDGVRTSDVASADDGVNACVVAADDGEDDACGVEGFVDITGGADDIDIVGDGGLGSCCEAKYS